MVTSSSETEKKSESVEAHIAVNVTSMKDEVDYFLSNHPKFEEDEQVDCTGNNVHYRGKNIIIEDEIGLIDFNSDVYSENFIVLLNGKDEMVATGTLTKCNDDYRISTNLETTVKKTATISVTLDARPSSPSVKFTPFTVPITAKKRTGIASQPRFR